MKFALVGVGGAGGRIVDRLHYEEQTTGRSFSNGSLLVFDTERSAFEAYDHVPLDRHVLVGDTHPDIRGAGVDGDIDLAVSVAREDRNELHREFDKLDLHKLDAVVVVAGLAGGTGGGLGAVILESLGTLTDIPLYAIGVLPDGSESDERVLNAAESLQSFVRLADSVIVFDNDAWHDSSAGPVGEHYDALNDQLTTRVSSMLGLNELADADIAENTLDSSDLMKTLSSGGVSAIGHASVELDGNSGFIDWLLSLFRNGQKETATDTTLAMRTQDLIQDAATQDLTVPCELSSADRALLIVSGPPDEISRKGFESGRYWLEQESDAGEVFAGDEPRRNEDAVTASVLLANVTEVPSIDRLKERAVDAKRGTSKTQPQD